MGSAAAGRDPTGETPPEDHDMIFRRRESVVGLDIGPDAVRAVTLRRTSRGREVDAIGREPVPRGSIAGGEIVDREAVTEAVRRTLERRRRGTRRVAAAVAGNAVIVKRVTLPLMDEDDLAGSIRSEAERYIPFDTRDVNLDYQILQAGRDVSNRASMDVLLVAAKKDRVAECAGVISRAGGVPVVIDVAAFALQNAFEINYGIDPGRVAMLVNMEAGGLNINIVEGGQTLLTRDVSPGGVADVLPPEPGPSFADAGLVDGPPGDGAGPEAAAGAVGEHLLLEIDKTLGFFRSATSAGRVDELLVSGGSAGAPGILPALEVRLDVPVSLFDPFRRVRHDPGGQDEVRRPASDAAFAVAVGLALRRGDDR